LSSSVFVIATDDPEQAAKSEADVRQQISFYASTPPYRPVFDLEGWGDVADQLKRFAAGGKWHEMPALITDEILERFALRGTWSELPGKMLQKYSGLLDRVSYYFPLVPGQNEAGWRATAAGFKS
jgi:hypothetical protein